MSKPNLKEIMDFDSYVIDGVERGVNPFGDVIDEDLNFLGKFVNGKIKKGPEPSYWTAVKKGEPEPKKPTTKEIADFNEVKIKGVARGVNRFGDVIDAEMNYLGKFVDGKIKRGPKPDYWEDFENDFFRLAPIR